MDASICSCWWWFSPSFVLCWVPANNALLHWARLKSPIYQGWTFDERVAVGGYDSIWCFLHVLVSFRQKWSSNYIQHTPRRNWYQILSNRIVKITSDPRRSNFRRRLLRAIDARRLMLQKEQGMAFARAAAAGFDMPHMSHLLVFADCFGATRLRYTPCLILTDFRYSLNL